mgnify:CR=1 FL=1
MIIPVKCFTCGNVLADKYLFYIKEVRKIKISKDMDTDEVLYLDNTNVKQQYDANNYMTTTMTSTGSVTIPIHAPFTKILVAFEI